MGTQGVRVVLLDDTGNTVGSSEKVFPLTPHSREEQSPELWWESVFECLQNLLVSVREVIDMKHIKAVSVTSTSGTVIPLDAHNDPLHDALMYSDPRPAAEGKLCRETAERYHSHGYTGFNASSGLSKMVWFVNHLPEKIGAYQNLGPRHGFYHRQTLRRLFVYGLYQCIKVWVRRWYRQMARLAHGPFAVAQGMAARSGSIRHANWPLTSRIK